MEINSVPTLSPQRQITGLPIIALDDHFKSEEDLQKRIPNVPSMIALRNLTLSGDIRFGNNIVLRVSPNQTVAHTNTPNLN